MLDCLYLNNDGSRWKYYDGHPGSTVVVQFPDGSTKIRKVEFWFSFGNFAGCTFKLKGKRRRFLPKGQDEKGRAIVHVTPEDLA